MDLPEADIEALAQLLDEGNLVILRAPNPRARRVKEALQRYTDRIWLFPMGAVPDRNHEIRVFRNGLPVYMGHEAEIVRVGRSQPIYAAVLLVPASSPLDVVQAAYTRQADR